MYFAMSKSMKTRSSFRWNGSNVLPSMLAFEKSARVSVIENCWDCHSKPSSFWSEIFEYEQIQLWNWNLNPDSLWKEDFLIPWNGKISHWFSVTMGQKRIVEVKNRNDSSAESILIFIHKTFIVTKREWIKLINLFLRMHVHKDLVTFISVVNDSFGNVPSFRFMSHCMNCFTSYIIIDITMCNVKIIRKMSRCKGI